MLANCHEMTSAAAIHKAFMLGIARREEAQT